MAYPVFEENAAIVAGGDAGIDIDYDALTTINANDILIVIVGDADNDSFSTPADWNKVTEFTANTSFSSAWFWMRATGSETGTVAFNSALSDGQVVAGVLLRFSGCVTDATPFDDSPASAGVTQGTTATISSIVTQGTDRLCCCLIGIEDNTGCDNDATDYAEQMDVTTTTGSDMGFCLYTQQIATAQTVNADSVTVGGNDYWATFTFALRNTAPAGRTTKNTDAFHHGNKYGMSFRI